MGGLLTDHLQWIWQTCYRVPLCQAYKRSSPLRITLITVAWFVDRQWTLHLQLSKWHDGHAHACLYRAEMLGYATLRAAATSLVTRACRVLICDVRIVRLLSSGPDLHQGNAPHDAHDPHDPHNASVSLASPVFGVWGSNTGVGKTLISAGLANAFLQQQVRLKCVMA